MHHLWRLRHFLDVQSAGSFHNAAKLSNISQPALTKSIRILETQIGAKVFDRSSMGVILTNAGRELLVHAQIIEREWNTAAVEINAKTSGASGSINLGAGPAYSANMFPALLSEMSTVYPNLRISLVTGVGTNLLPALKKGDISLYAGALPTELDKLGNEFDTIFIKEQIFTLVASDKHPLRKQISVRAEDLLSYPWLRMLYDQEASNNIESFFKEQGLGNPRVMIETQSLAVAFSLIAQNKFIASQPKDLTAKYAHNGVKVLDFPDFNWKIKTGITYRKSALELAPIRTVIDILTRKP